MDSFLRTSNSNRYIIDDDSIPKVTSDGKPHEMMTLVAGVSGLIAAIIILTVLVSLLGCKEHDKKQTKNVPKLKSIAPLMIVPKSENDNCSRIIPVFIRQKKLDIKNTELNLISIIPNQSVGCTNFGYEINQNDNYTSRIILDNSQITIERF